MDTSLTLTPIWLPHKGRHPDQGERNKPGYERTRGTDALANEEGSSTPSSTPEPEVEALPARSSSKRSSRQSMEPPMTILGTCVLFLVFPPVDGIFATKVRVVDQLPIGLILGTEFMRRYESSMSFEGPGSGFFKPTPTSLRVPLLPWLEQPRRRPDGASIVDSDVTSSATENGAVMTLNGTEWTISLDDDVQSSAPSDVLAMEALDLGATAWEDAGTQQWDMSITREISVPGGVCAEIDVTVTGSLPHSKTLVVVYPTAPFDLEGKASLGVARGVQWWIPGTPLKVKVDNRGRTPSGLPKGTRIAKAYAVNSDDVERMILLKEPLPEKEPEPRKESPPFRPKTAPPDPMPDGTIRTQSL